MECSLTESVTSMQNTQTLRTSCGSLIWALACSTVFLTARNNLHAALSEGLVSYWPLDEVLGDKTPDLVSGYDMVLNNLTAADLVAGKLNKCFSFSNARKT